MDRLDSLVRELRETAGTQTPPGATVGADAGTRRCRNAPSTHARRRLLITGLVLLCSLVVLLGHARTTTGSTVRSTHRAARTPADTQATPTPAGWRAVVEELDRRRGLAFVHASMSALRSVDYASSAALASDEAMMRALVQMGAHARTFPLHVKAVHEEYVRVDGQESRALLTVTDVMDAYDIVDASGRVLRHVPARGEQRWHVVLRYWNAGGWRYATVSAASP